MKTKQTAFRLKIDLLNSLKHYCIDHDMKYVDVVSGLLHEFLAREGYIK